LCRSCSSHYRWTQRWADQGAAITTLALFGALTAVVFITRKDFSFLRGILMFGGFAAMGLIVVAILFNFNLGPIFIYAMIALSCGYILYYTSNVLAPLSHRPARGRSIGFVRGRGPAVLVHPAVVHVEGLAGRTAIAC
jgi:hypothetical protein